MDAVGEGVERIGDGLHGAVSTAISSVFRTVCGKSFLPNAAVGYSQGVGIPGYRSEIEHGHKLPLGACNAAEGDHAGIPIVGKNPLERFPAPVVLPQSLLFQVEKVQIPDEGMKAFVGRVIQKEIIQPVLRIPSGKLGNFVPHKGELFAGMCHHVEKKQTEVGKFAVIVSRHPVNQRRTAGSRPVMGEGEQICFGEGGGKRLGYVLVPALAEQGIQLKIIQRVFGPVGIPLEIKAQTAAFGIGGDAPPTVITSGKSVWMAWFRACRKEREAAFSRLFPPEMGNLSWGWVRYSILVTPSTRIPSRWKCSNQ